jgi:hypothetical protein
MPRWRALALKIKRDNIKRPAFQEEFAKAVPGGVGIEIRSGTFR